MPRFLAAVIALAAAAVVVPLSGTAAYARVGDQRTLSYAVDLDVDAQGRLKVTETIDFDFGDQKSHGVTREIPTQPATDDGVFVEDATASSPDHAPARMTVSRDRSTTKLRIGDPDRTVTGRHTYVISYTAGGAAKPGDSVSHVAWNAIGTFWQTSIAKATVRLHAPAKGKHPECYAGVEGSRQKCARTRAHGRTVDFSGGALSIGNGITVEADYPDSAVTASPLAADRQRVSHEEGDLTGTRDSHGDSSGHAWVFALVIPGAAALVLFLIRVSGGGGGGGGWRGGGFSNRASGGSFIGGSSGGGFGGGGGGGGVGGGGGGGGGGSW